MQESGSGVGHHKKVVRPSLCLPIKEQVLVVSVDLETEDNVTLAGECVPCDPNDLEQLDFLGHGDSGDVNFMLHRPTGTPLAVKKIVVCMDSQDIKELLQEIEAIRKCGSCQHIVSIYGSFFRERFVWICLEPMDTSLEKFAAMLNSKGESIPETAMSMIVLPVIKGLQFLYHKVKTANRDIKPADILLNAKGEVKLGDYGIRYTQLGAMAMARDNSRCPYMAPDRVQTADDAGEITNECKSDVWSLGIILTELAIGRYPYPESTPLFELLVKIVVEEPPGLPTGEFSSQFEDFISICLKKDYSSRGTLEQLLTHPFLLDKDDGIDMASYLTSYGDLRTF